MANVSSQIALNFIQSQEYANRSRDNGQFVEDLYDAILRRGADLSGFTYWVGQLSSGMTRQAVLSALISSSEFQGRVQNVINAGCIQ